MTNLEYILSLNDKMSSKLSKIGITSDTALDKFSKLQKKANDVSRVMKDMGGSVGALREKVNLLQAEKEWIPASNIQAIRKYNQEIDKLEKEIEQLNKAGRRTGGSLKQAFSQIPGASFLTNPWVIAGAAMFKSTKMAFQFDEGMAKINTTAQLSNSELSKLKTNLINIGTSAHADLTKVPEAFEKILSQTNDVALSTDILKQALKGSKGGFTDVETVSGALAQSLSLIGKENANAKQVLDTFFAAKRVGAGEFKDFAHYIPELIASGKALGLEYKQTAGLFAYMTGKGQSMERSATLMENAFSALQKIDIQKNLKKEGVNIFDKQGAVRDIDAIISDFNHRLKGMSDQGKSNFLARMGIVDKEARSAFMVMSSDASKLSKTLKEVANSDGETDKAFKASLNPMQKLQLLMSKIQSVGITLGGALSNVLVPVMEFLIPIVEKSANTFNWLVGLYEKGNPIIYSLTFAVLGFVAIMKANVVWTAMADLWAKRKIITDKASIFWTNLRAIKEKALLGISYLVTGATWLWTVAQNALNTAMWANPTTWIIAGIIALVAIISYVIFKIDGWGKMWSYTLKAMKSYYMTWFYGIKTSVLALAKPFIDSFDVIRTGWYKLMALWDKDGSRKGLENIAKNALERKRALEESKQNTINSAKNTVKFTVLAGKSLNINDNTLAGTSLLEKLGFGDDKKIPGIKPVNGISGTTQNDAKGKNGAGKADLLSQKNESIATGGTRNTNINITFKNMVDKILIEGKDFKESTQEMSRLIQDEFLRVLAMAKTSS